MSVREDRHCIVNGSDDDNENYDSNYAINDAEYDPGEGEGEKRMKMKKKVQFCSTFNNLIIFCSEIYGSIVISSEETSEKGSQGLS